MTATPPPAQPTGYTPAPAAKTNTLAIVGLILAIVVPVVGLIISIIANNQIKQTGEGGAGLAKAGIIVGIIFTILGVIGIIANIALLGAATTYGS
ncbi:hypothetical protein GCM10027515_15890 [Schumannella luteola]|uniref:Thiol:disulfide interchange protein n=1 Tax=Schumannella luteola TaxID=472059 RepID=A0A852YHJ2_9MICO|nr:DUF4190 domain-containing protein [Schumannella luteola]NYH00612.1 thiol:disulfide interchange protein [Schumannella luteola]TPX04928.1 DUF4190 domain-containing protein [Schumannella luteola]